MDSVCVGMGSTPNIDPSVGSSAEYLRTDAYGPLGQCGEWILEAAVRLGSQKSLRRPLLQVFNPPSACVIVQGLGPIVQDL